VQSLISGVSGASSSGQTASTSNATSGTQDSNGLSPFAQILGSLQQLQQSSPAQYQQVTQQLSANLTSAAQTATANGNTAQAAQLTTLAKDFQTASSTGQLPSVKDLASAIGGHHHHHGHGQAGGAAATYQQSASETSTASDPLSIITATLNQAGINTTSV
jgi:hypothetical protein